MRRRPRLIIGGLLAYLCLALGWAVWQILPTDNGPFWSWGGLILAAGAALSGLLWDLSRGQPGQRPPLMFTVLCGLGLAISMSQSYRYGDAAGWAHAAAGVALIARISPPEPPLANLPHGVSGAPATSQPSLSEAA